MELKNYVFVIVFIASFSFLIYNIRIFLKKLSIGQPEKRTDNSAARIVAMLKIAFGQTKIFRDKAAGPLHGIIFWGFLIFLFAVLEAIIQGFYSGFSLKFLGPIFTVITVVQDFFILFILIGIIISLLRRFVFRVERLKVDPKGELDAGLILILIFIVAASMLGQNSAHLAIHNFHYSAWEYKPISLAVSKIFFSSGCGCAATAFEIFWWGHIITIFFFMNYLFYSKHFHVYSSVPNVYLSKQGEHKYALKPLDLEDEEAEQFGTADVQHLSWKQILDGYTCTECGRCWSVCPAASTGKKLSPRKIMEDIRHRTEEKFRLLKTGADNTEENQLVHGYISSEELWACTTCNACVFECPVMNEHVDAIVDMRRNLALMEADFPPELNSVFKNLETNFSPWAFNPQDRANWAEGLGIKTMSDDPGGEILFWVGCAGSYDARYQKVSVAFSKIMQKANINFRILGNEEKCNGDTARRLGNEYLAQMMISENIDTLNKYNVKKIVTACPHCFNSLKHEYPQFGGNFEVVHHSEFIAELLQKEKIKINEKSEKNRVTFHDSCYLGRYNEIYDAPRASLNKIQGVELVEMERNKDRGFCCGAGGGRMFLEENEGSRINEERTREAIQTNADTIASACPFCMTMLNDGLKSADKSDDIDLLDVAEIIYKNIN